MPVYEYRCSSCNREFEYQQRMADAPKDVCEACGGKLERMISRSAFQLKGAGWGKDLYASRKPGDRKEPLEKTNAPNVTAEYRPSPPSGGDSSSSGGSGGGGGDSGSSSGAGSSSSGAGSSGGSGGGGSTAAASVK